MSEQPSSWSFSNVARQAACLLGTPFAFAAACAVVILWAVTGPVFGYSDTWQLVINTGTTIVTFPDGVPGSKHPEPRLARSAPQAGRSIA